MKNVAVALVLFVVVLGCDISKFTKSGEQGTPNSSKPSPTAEPKPSVSTPPKPESTPSSPAFLTTLRKSAGKYPNDIKLLDIAELRDRLKKLVGKDFAGMKSNWNVETPMELSGDIFKAEACQAHNCGSNRYVLFVDLKNDNINVFHVEDSVPKTYFEHGEIKLPGKFAADLAGE
jgi:hypothetical protein